VILHDCEVIGPIARTTSDLARVFDVIARSDPEDRASLAFPDGPSRSARAPLRRVFYTPSIEGHPVDPEIKEACAKAAQQLADMGFEVMTGPAPFDFPLYEKHWPTIRDAGLAWLMRGREWQGRISDLHASLATRGQTVTGADYVDALDGFREIQAAFGRFFERYDLFMTPTAGTLPWPAAESGPARSRVFTGIVNAAGNPAISIPIAHSPGALPIGFQLVGRFGSDTELIAIAERFEERHSWIDLWPPV
jgi:aspartyl-tRNA(Asn)/glutamyl-tRNA(Gln) amidotransferase subunit A